MGASLALAGVQGCVEQPQEKIVPYVRPPEQIVPGRPLYYATAMTLGGANYTSFESLIKQNAGPLTLTGGHVYSAGVQLQGGSPCPGLTARRVWTRRMCGWPTSPLG